jgi:hypothetical protein
MVNCIIKTGDNEVFDPLSVSQLRRLQTQCVSVPLGQGSPTTFHLQPDCSKESFFPNPTPFASANFVVKIEKEILNLLFHV